MAKFTLGTAALGVSLLGSSAAIAQSMTLTSADLKEGGTIVNEQVFKGFGCEGGNLSPALSWSGAPSGTKSFVKKPKPTFASAGVSRRPTSNPIRRRSRLVLFSSSTGRRESSRPPQNRKTVEKDTVFTRCEMSSAASI